MHCITASIYYQKEDSKTTVSPSKKRRPSSEQPCGNALRRVTSTPLTGGSRLWSRDHARDTTDSMPTCSRKWSWHHHQPATAVLKTRRPNVYCRDAHFCRQQEQICGQRQSSYTPNSRAARRDWRRRPHSSCRLDSQCSGHREEEFANGIQNTQKKQFSCTLAISGFQLFCNDTNTMMSAKRWRFCNNMPSTGGKGVGGDQFICSKSIS